MDEKLQEILELKQQGEQMLEYTKTKTEESLALEIINAANELINTYIKYKKAEEKHRESINARNRYNTIINNIN